MIKDNDGDLLLMYRVVNRWLDANNDYHQVRRGKIGRGLRMDLDDIMNNEYCGVFGYQDDDGGKITWSEPDTDNPLDD